VARTTVETIPRYLGDTLSIGQTEVQDVSTVHKLHSSDARGHTGPTCPRSCMQIAVLKSLVSGTRKSYRGRFRGLASVSDDNRVIQRVLLELELQQ